MGEVEFRGKCRIIELSRADFPVWNHRRPGLLVPGREKCCRRNLRPVPGRAADGAGGGVDPDCRRWRIISVKIIVDVESVMERDIVAPV